MNKHYFWGIVNQYDELQTEIANFSTRSQRPLLYLPQDKSLAEKKKEFLTAMVDDADHFTPYVEYRVIKIRWEVEE